MLWLPLRRLLRRRLLLGARVLTSAPKMSAIWVLTMARMPMIDPTSWRVGHYFRRVPRGYRESLEADANRLEAPQIRSLYDDVRKVTRGPLFARGRLSAIVRLNLGSDQARR